MGNPLKEMRGPSAHRPVKGATKVEQGDMVGVVVADGYARPFEAGDVFGGHAVETEDNAAGADGAMTVECRRGTYFAEVDVTGVVQTSVAARVYATDKATLTLTGTPGTDEVGTVDTVVAAGRAVVEFRCLRPA